MGGPNIIYSTSVKTAVYIFLANRTLFSFNLNSAYTYSYIRATEIRAVHKITPWEFWQGEKAQLWVSFIF